MQIGTVAAGFTAGEADQLRCAMAAWKRKGGLEKFEDKLMADMAERGFNKEFSASIVSQIRGLSEYDFPNRTRPPADGVPLSWAEQLHGRKSSTRLRG